MMSTCLRRIRNSVCRNQSTNLRSQNQENAQICRQYTDQIEIELFAYQNYNKLKKAKTFEILKSIESDQEIKIFQKIKKL